jgi:hypothetical protein
MTNSLVFAPLARRVSRAAVALAACFALGSTALADGMNPGSLLIFPEYDSTTGRDTLITVTNTSSTLTVSITYEYVHGTAPNMCLQSDRHATLTPNDTLTVLVSNHLGAARPGFLYVFASNASGSVALSQNVLIGDNLVLNGTNSLQYSIAPLVYRALTAPGSDTDVDHDGIRDLNGMEYEPAPGRILIPRFMGQSASHASDLILIGLTGGAKFTTIADFVIFNDNEVPLSAQFSFPCWTKVPLSDISSVFSRTFLQQNTDDNAQEILGQSTYESGWMIVEGALAQSVNTSFNDPAILAVLIEKTMTGSLATTRSAAEIPFIQGRRQNGALWPLSNNGMAP